MLFRSHYSIPPPGVKARFTIFWFLLSFRYFGWKCEVYVWIVYAVILYVYSFCVGASGGFALPSPSQCKALRHREAPERTTKKRPFPGALRICIFFVKKKIFRGPVSSASARPLPGTGGTAALRCPPDRRRTGAPPTAGCCRGSYNSRSRSRR